MEYTIHIHPAIGATDNAPPFTVEAESEREAAAIAASRLVTDQRAYPVDTLAGSKVGYYCGDAQARVIGPLFWIE